MAKPPAGSSLLFSALVDSGQIKRCKNGSYRMVLKGVDEIDQFTVRPNRVTGLWSPKKLLKEWVVLFSDGALNVQSTFEMGSKLKLVIFEMSKPKLSDSNQTLSFKVRGISEKNKDLLTGLRNKRLSDASLFIDDGTTGDTTVTMKVWNDSHLWLEMRSLSSNAILGQPKRVPDHYTDVNLLGEEIKFRGGLETTSQNEGIFTVPVTLKNGLKSPPVEFSIQYRNTTILPPPKNPEEGSFAGMAGQCDRSSAYSNNGPTTIYYSIDGGSTQSVEATCEKGGVF